MTLAEIERNKRIWEDLYAASRAVGGSVEKSDPITLRAETVIFVLNTLDVKSS